MNPWQLEYCCQESGWSQGPHEPSTNGTLNTHHCNAQLCGEIMSSWTGVAVALATRIAWLRGGCSPTSGGSGNANDTVVG